MKVTQRKGDQVDIFKLLIGPIAIGLIFGLTVSTLAENTPVHSKGTVIFTGRRSGTMIEYPLVPDMARGTMIGYPLIADPFSPTVDNPALLKGAHSQELISNDTIVAIDGVVRNAGGDNDSIEY